MSIMEENKIEEWQEELDTIWAGKDTDAAEVERRNLMNLINNAQKEIDEIENGPVPKESTEDLEKKFEDIKSVKSEKAIKINRLKMHIEKLQDERENYESKKNSAYKDIYAEYTKQIEEAEKELEGLEKEDEYKEKDEQLRTITLLRKEYEEQIKAKEKEIREVEREIEDIEFGTEESMIEKELEDGTKVKTPKILELYKKLDVLKSELKDIESKKEECQKYIDEIKGIEEKTETRQLDSEEIKYYHEQNDNEYYGFEGHRGDRKEPGPVKTDPIPDPVPPKPDPIPPRPIPPRPDPVPPGPVPPKKDPINITSGRKQEIRRIKVCPFTNTIDYEMVTKDGALTYKTEELDYTNLVKVADVIDILEELGVNFNEDELDHAVKDVDPNIVRVLKENDPEALNSYIKEICSSKKLSMDIEYDLKDMYKSDMLYNKEKSNLSRIAKVAKNLGADVQKDNIFKRAFDSIKSLISKQTRKALVEDNKTYGKVWEEYKPEEVDNGDQNEHGDDEKDKKKSKLLERLKRKERYQPKHAKKGIISKSKSIAKSIGRETVGGFKIAGVRLKGYLKGESKAKTNIKVNEFRQKYFYGPVDHEKAKANVEKGKEEKVLTTEDYRPGIDPNPLKLILEDNESIEYDDDEEQK